MGLTTEISLHDNVLGLSREQALKTHLDINFYPKLPANVKESIIKAFSEYWDGKIEDDSELAERCCLRDVAGLYRYFSTFMEN